MKLSIFVGRFFSGVLLLGLIGVFSHEHVSAQSSVAELESCFVYYDYGRVKVELSSDKSEYIVGENMVLEGQVINDNSFPLINVDIYAQLRRVNKDTFNDNGHYLVDQFYLKRGVNLLPGAASHFKNSYQINSTYPNGEYVLQYYVFSPQGFHYAGRPFLEEDVAGTTNVIITGGEEPILYFDVDSLIVNGINKPIRHTMMPELDTNSITIQMPLVDLRDEKEPVNVTVEVYKFEDVIGERLLVTDDTLVTNGVFRYTYNLTEKGAFVVVATVDDIQKSQVKYRFASVRGAQAAVRFNDLGISAFPPQGDSRAWVCMHSPTNENTEETTITLLVLDAAQNEVSSALYTGPINPAVTALSVSLDQIPDIHDFWIKAEARDAVTDSVIHSVTTHYNCSLLANSLQDFTIQYNKQKKNIVVEGRNACGDMVSDLTINHLRITNTETNDVVLEETYVNGSPYSIDVSGFEQGDFIAEVRVGDTTKNATFAIAGTMLSVVGLHGGSIWILVVIVISILLITGIVMYRVHLRSNAKNEKI